jgi:hypothetical protein
MNCLEIKIETAVTFLRLLKIQGVSKEGIQIIYKITIDFLSRFKDKLTEAWLQVFAEILKYIPESQIQQELN